MATPVGGNVKWMDSFEEVLLFSALLFEHGRVKEEEEEEEGVREGK